MVFLPAAAVVTLSVWCCNCDKARLLCGCSAGKSVNEGGSAAGAGSTDAEEEAAGTERTRKHSLLTDEGESVTQYEFHVNEGTFTVSEVVTAVI